MVVAGYLHLRHGLEAMGGAKKIAVEGGDIIASPLMVV